MAHCDERINALQSTCNSPALQIGTHRTEQDEHSQLDGKRNDAKNETLAQSAAECTRIMDELQKWKSRLVEAIHFSFGNKCLIFFLKFYICNN
jgi:hypothetical protein